MLNQLTLSEAIHKIKEKKVSLSEIYDDIYQVIENNNSKLNVYLSIDEDALSKAKNQKKNKLSGLPIAAKDNYCTKNLKTTASAKLLKNFKPKYESTVTKKIKQAGGVIIGKTNLDAWAHGSTTETSDFGTSLNPLNTNYSPGGSSGGSAAAVAGNLCLAAVGSETAGSIRTPASWCGVVGLKPTYGRVSRFGIIAMASSFDSPGPLTKTVEDATIMLSVMSGHDPLDATCLKKPAPDFTDKLKTHLKGMKIGILYHNIDDLKEVNDQLESEYQIFKDLGAQIEYTDALDPHYAISVYTIIQRAEVYSNLTRFDGVRMGQTRDYFEHQAKKRMMLGAYALSTSHSERYYELAQKCRRLYLDDFEKLFKKYDVLIGPSSPGYAMKVGASEGHPHFGELVDLLEEPSSITGLPGISIPTCHDPKTNLYLGLNIMAPQFREDLLLQAAHAYEVNTNWNPWRK